MIKKSAENRSTASANPTNLWEIKKLLIRKKKWKLAKLSCYNSVIKSQLRDNSAICNLQTSEQENIVMKLSKAILKVVK